MTKAQRRDAEWQAAREAQRARMVDELFQGSARRRAKPDVFLFDLDGTLCRVDERDPLDARSCDEDPPNPVVVAVARSLQASGYGLVFSSGRKEEHRARTHAWLIWQGHFPEYLKLVMRPQGDTRPDYILKVDLYRREIEPHFHVVGVFDDRNSVVQAWRAIGLTVFQVDNRVD